MREENVWLKRGGKLVVEILDDEDVREFDVVDSHKLLYAWNMLLKIENGATLGDMLDAISDPHMLETVETITHEHVGKFLTERQPPDEQPPADEYPDKDKVTSLEVYHNIEIENFSDEKNFESSSYHSAHGMSDDGQAWAMEFTPWHKLVDIPLKVGKTFVSKSYWRKTGKKENWFGREKDGMERVDEECFNVTAQGEMRLGEFLDGLFNELCFFGDPGYRDGKKDELEKTCEDIKSGKAKLVDSEGNPVEDAA